MMTDQHDDIEALFAQARAVTPVVSDGLFARIMADAAAVDMVRQPRAPVLPQKGWFAGLLAALGGWPALGGLAMATVAGVWIGVAPPTQLTDIAVSLWGGTETVSLSLQDDVFGLEG